MDHLPGLLAAMYRAPRCSTIRGTIRHWTDHGLRRQRLQRPGRSATAILVVASEDGQNAPAPDPAMRVWVDGERWRVDQHDNVTIEDAVARVQYSPAVGAIRTPGERREPFAHPHWLWAPRRLIDVIDIEAVGTGERLGRPVWRVRGVADGADHFGTFMILLAGDRYEFDIDQATGAVLAMRVTTDGGETLDDIEWTSIEVDVPFDDDVFELVLPQGQRIRSANELTLEALARDGIDIAGVDPDDDGAVNALLEQRRLWRTHLDPLAQVVPAGEPPDDEEAARAAIESAVAHLPERDGDRLVNVQAGDGLAPFLDRARQRYAANIRADRIRFVSSTSAVVLVAIERDDGSDVIGPQAMRAVVDDGAWKVERSSLTSLLGMAGVHCPPPPAR